MPKLFAICRMQGGNPDVDFEATPVKGYVHCDSIGNQGAYLFSGTASQLASLNALPQVLGIVAVTHNGEVKWAELDGTIPAGVRAKLNGWLTERGHPTIPVGWSYRRVVNAVFKRLNTKFDLDEFDIAD